MDSPINVTKMSGEKEPYSEEKVMSSMKRTGVREELRPVILEHVRKRLYPDIKTTEIYSSIREFLHDKDISASIKFNLKQAIFDLGPTGFPFEKYLSRIFEHQGYTVQVDIIMEGECIRHEVDLLLEKEGKREIVEAKFHNMQGVKTDIHVLLYTYARFLDLKDKNHLDNVWVITNTKLSGDSIEYAKCKNINVIAWSYPAEGNLQDRIENAKLYPVTILDLSHREKKQLLDNGYTLCQDLLNIPESELMDLLEIDKERLSQITRVVEYMYGTQPQVSKV